MATRFLTRQQAANDALVARFKDQSTYRRLELADSAREATTDEATGDFFMSGRQAGVLGLVQCFRERAASGTTYYALEKDFR